MNAFREYVPVGEVRGHVLRAWSLTKPEKRGWNAVPCNVARFLLRDGRLVEQEWPVGAETPTAHYVVSTGTRVEEEVAMMDRSPRWADMAAETDVVAGARR